MKNLRLFLVLFYLSIILIISLNVLNKTWGIFFARPQVASHQIKEGEVSQVFVNVSASPRFRVPEPSSLLLFTSGILTMLLTFLKRTYNIAKRGLDLIIATLALIVLSPICLLVAILIKFNSKGPVFYTQIRAGKDGQPFEMCKFRTMKIDAEKESGPVWAKFNDNRITPLGKFLRKSRIDEIPQFINVLYGDMSVIGPRPERPIFVEKLKSQISDYPKRLSIKPGITGLAQVYNPYDENIADVRKKVKYDILYIKRMSFGTDMRIVGRTFGVILTGFGAH